MNLGLRYYPTTNPDRCEYIERPNALTRLCESNAPDPASPNPGETKLPNRGRLQGQRCNWRLLPILRKQRPNMTDPRGSRPIDSSSKVQQPPAQGGSMRHTRSTPEESNTRLLSTVGLTNRPSRDQIKTSGQGKCTIGHTPQRIRMVHAPRGNIPKRKPLKDKSQPEKFTSTRTAYMSSS